MRKDEGQQSVWHLQGPRWRTFARVWLTVTSIALLATFFIDDVRWGTRLGAVCNVIASLAFMVVARMGSSADAQGIEITQLRTRRMPWGDVEEVRPDLPGRWATSIRAHLTDGSEVTMPAVTAADLPRLEELRTAEARPPQHKG